MSNCVLLTKDFDTEQASIYHLSIQIHLDGFSFAVVQRQEGKCLAIKGIQAQTNGENAIDNLKKKIQDEKLLNVSYQSVSALWITPKATLIPTKYFSKENVWQSFRLCHHLEDSDTILWNEIPLLECHQVFAIPQNLLDFLRSQFRSIQVFHHTYPFLLTAKKELKSNHHPAVNVNVERSFLDVAIMNGENRFFANSFSYRSINDMVYYILNVYKQRKLDPKENKLILSGNIHAKDKAFSLLKKYLKHIEFKKLPDTLTFPAFTEHQQIEFANLLNLHQCE